jgi:hypothetical protein
MRSCPRHLHIKMLRGMECSDGGYTPLLYRPWFMTMLLVLWVVLIIVAATAE